MRAAELAERICARASVPAQVLVVEGRQRTTRLGAGVVLNLSDVECAEATITVLIDGAEGSARTTCLDDEGLGNCLARAELAARARPADPDHPGLLSEAQAGSPQGEAAWDEATAEGGNPRESAVIGEAIEAARAHGAELAGLILRRWEHRAVANTTGLLRADRRTVAQARYIATRQAGGGYRDGVADAESGLDHRSLADEAGRVAARGVDPQPVDPGLYDVVLSPQAVIGLLEWLAYIGFGSRCWEDGTSFLAGREGEKLTGSCVSVWDPGPEDSLPMGFDDEGCARRRVDFLVDGVACGPVHDRSSAARAGCAATGHTVQGGLFPSSGARASAIHMAGGEHEDLLRDLEHGLFIERFHYINGFLDPRKARMTGLTRDGLFEVRDGQLGRALGDLRFTEDILDAFSRIDAVSALRHTAPAGSRGHGTYAAPAVRIRGFRFTGSAARAPS